MPHRSAIARVVARPSLVAARSVTSAASPSARPSPDLDQPWLAPGNPPVSRDKGGLLPESSSQAQQRSSTRFHFNHNSHVQHFGPPPQPPQLPKPNKHADTISSAMRKVIEIHSREPTAITEPAQISSLANIPLPSLLHRLVSRRQFRLAVFHLLNTPTLASDPKLGLQLADMLENRGAGKLASRLRRSYEIEDRSHPRKLAQDLRGSKNEPRTQRFWTVKPSPPEPLDETPLRGRTPEQRLTSHLNAQLSFHLRKSSLTPRMAPLQDRDAAKAPPGPRWPEPAPNLLQLRRLLYTISRLEIKQGFCPDRVTANIIIRCWLRCGQGPSPESDPFRVRLDREGNERITEKQASHRILGSKEIMLMFRIVTTVMDKSIRSINLESQKEEGEVDWRAHVQPFSTMVLRELRRLGDKEAVRAVVGWEKQTKEILKNIRKTRAYLQRTPSSDSDK